MAPYKQYCDKHGRGYYYRCPECIADYEKQEIERRAEEARKKVWAERWQKLWDNTIFPKESEQ